MLDNQGVMASSGTALDPAAQAAPPEDGGDARSFMLHEGDDSGSVPGDDVLVREIGGRVDIRPVIHPDRKPPQRNVGKAWYHFKRYIKDKEQTNEVVAVFDNLPWRELHDEAAAFLQTERGREIYRAEPYLPTFLDDHEALRCTPKGSFAHAYCDFMEREGLTAAGMVEATKAREDANYFDDGVNWYIERLRDFHDILHIVTGYGRDILGEQCIFAYMYHQRPSPGHLYLAWIGALMVRAQALRSRAPIIGALREARRNGKGCPRIVEQPIQELFALPLEEVRARFNTPAPHVYHKVMDIFREEGIDPHAFLAKQED
ncbi:Coq4 family protein [Alteriqipengyuania lutimaris]|uniref:Coq4 family protein n=1 Tax=Alteriqipengyuania lutimaris TaxID=1538146 RepID=UPI001CFF3494|nr:Coq4 family protein [Alteriqipengyuania lutimaris]